MAFLDVADVLTDDFFVNMIIAGRNSGKTYSSVKLIAETALKEIDEDINVSKNTFIYLRRNDKNCLEIAKQNLFIKQHYPIICRGNQYFIGKGKEAPLCGLAVPLSSVRSRGFEIPNLRYVFFDEFTVNMGYKYLKNEFTIFADFLESVCRLSEDVQVIMTGNSGNFYNPYIIGWNINCPFNQKRWSDRERSITFRNYVDNEFMVQRNNSRIAKLFKNTQYDEWAGQNQFTENTFFNVEKMPQKTKPYFCFAYGNTMFLFSYSQEMCKMYISYYNNKMNIPVFQFNKENIQENMILFNSGNPYIRLLRHYFTYGRLCYTTEKIKYQFMPILQFIQSIS